MPDFTYTGPDERYYPSLSLTVHPGDSVRLDSDPGDGRFAPAGTVPVAPASEPDYAPDVAPVDDSPEVGA